MLGKVYGPSLNSIEALLYNLRCLANVLLITGLPITACRGRIISLPNIRKFGVKPVVACTEDL
jgi:hypothetical protein